MLSFGDVERIFGAVYGELREANGEHAPSSFTWFAPTFEGLAEEVGDLFPDGLADGGFDPDRHPSEILLIGGNEDPTVAWVYECNGRKLTRITATATADEVYSEFRADMGFED